MASNTLWASVNFLGQSTVQRYVVFESTVELRTLYHRKLTLHEIKVLEINANLMEKDFQIKKINAKEEVEFHDKGN